MNIELVLYSNETAIATNLIIKFWQIHNNFSLDYEDALADLVEWTKDGHRLYLISYNNIYIGFIHDCLNTITIRKDFQPGKYETIHNERINNMDFKVKKRIN